MLFTGYFIYGGVNSSVFHLVFANLDTNKLKEISGTTEYTTEFYDGLNRHEILGSGWDGDPFSFEVEVISEQPISDLDAKKIKRWMFNSPHFQKLYEGLNAKKSLDEFVDRKIKRSYVECVFQNPSEIRKSGNLFGWRCTCLLATPMAVQDPTEVEYTDFSQPITIDVDTDFKGYTYPYVEIKAGNSSPSADITIKNITDKNRSMQVKSVTAKSTLYVDCGVGSITDSSEYSYYDKLTDQKFLRLLPGVNTLEVTGDVEKLKLRWNNARYFM